MIARLQSCLRALATLDARAHASPVAQGLRDDCADALRLQLDCMQADLAPSQRMELERLNELLESPSVGHADLVAAARSALAVIGVARISHPRFELHEGIALLERTPLTLRALLSGLPTPWVDSDEGPGTWSPFVVVGHLIHGERTDWIPRARIILAQGASRTFEPFDRHAQLRDSEGKSLEVLLDELEALRAENLAILRGWELTARQLALEGVHPDLGPVTLRQLLATWVAHDLSHLAQVARVMARRYHDDVGPWRAYLSIMERPTPAA